MPRLDLMPTPYEELLALPEYMIGEIVGGRLLTRRLPPPRHAYAYLSVVRCFGVDECCGIRVFPRVEVHLERDILVPDLAGWRRERMPRLPETAWFELPPDWVCEILSPSTARVDRAEKLPIYARHGVKHAWLVDPDLRTLEVFENRASQWLLLTVLEDAAAVSQPPFDATSFALDALWAE